MPTFFHGTLLNNAIAMSRTPANGSIDVTLGGGEFGQGFYTQSSRSNALTWAQNHCGNPLAACILEVEVEPPAFAAMSKCLLNRKQALRLTQRLRKKGTTRTHRVGVDVAIGPLAGSRRIKQQKFESLQSQEILNGLQTQRRVV